jgi:hypothetical protein
VYRTVGYQAKRVSTHALEELLAYDGGLRTISACAFTHEGHSYLRAAAAGDRPHLRLRHDDADVARAVDGERGRALGDQHGGRARARAGISATA